MSAAVLLHLTTPAAWRMALTAGSVTPASLVQEGFIHLSTPEQVVFPANALFAGRDDTVVLLVDPTRLRAPIRWEPGDSYDRSSMRFPHLYGPLPVAAVIAVAPYRPGPDGRYSVPARLPAPADRAARAQAFDPSLAARRAAMVTPVRGGFAVLEPRFARSREHNTLWLTDPVPADVVVDEAARVLAGAGLDHRKVMLDDESTARALRDLGWDLTVLKLMVFDGPSFEAAHAVVPVTSEVMAPFWASSWRRDFPTMDDETVRQLVGREPLADAVLRVVDLAVLENGAPVAGTQLRIDGATAAIEAAMTHPDHRGRGLASALVGEAVSRAVDAGCDVVWLGANADDWPRHWYGRLGFVEVATRYEATAGPRGGAKAREPRSS